MQLILILVMFNNIKRFGAWNFYVMLLNDIEILVFPRGSVVENLTCIWGDISSDFWPYKFCGFIRFFLLKGSDE